MKIQIKKTMAILLVALLATMLLVSMASAKTATKDFPAKEEVLTFVKSYQDQSNFIQGVSADSEYYYPEWVWDIWKDKYGDYYISFYYKINDKKYGSIYYDSEGVKISPKNLNLKLVKSYVGD